jgi:hypothetical protein
MVWSSPTGRQAATQSRTGRLPDSGPQSAEEETDEAGELPTRPRPAASRSRLPDGGPQTRSAEDDADEACAGELPARLHPAASRCLLPDGGRLPNAEDVVDS